jgi:Tfp pilus assembly protein PilF
VAEVPAQLDITSSNPTVQISDGSLDSELSDKLGPARSASLRSVDQARAQMMSGDVDGSIRALSRALSIDSSNPYAYFYLGRAYFVKNNPQQALTFLQRAALGFGSNPAWLGETYGFEGAAYEASGRTSEAAAAYKRALDTAPNNRMARAGYGRVAPVSYASPGPENIAPAPWIVNSPSSNNGTNGPIPIPPPPDVAPPLPAPAPSR